MAIKTTPLFVSDLGMGCDVYKLSAQAFFEGTGWGNLRVGWRMIVRTPGVEFPKHFDHELREQVIGMSQARYSPQEIKHLLKYAYWLPPQYVRALSQRTLEPDMVKISQRHASLLVTVEGSWSGSTEWELRLMATIEALWNHMTGRKLVSDHLETVERRARSFRKHRLFLSSFGQRRAYSPDVYSDQVGAIKRGAGLVSQGGVLLGESGLYAAAKHDIPLGGTMPHELFIVLSTIFGLEGVYHYILGKWLDFFDGSVGYLLPDTFTTPLALRHFTTRFAKAFDGVRHDSGDWREFTDRIVAHYRMVNVDPTTKYILYSNGVNPELAMLIHRYAQKLNLRDRYGPGQGLIGNLCGAKPPAPFLDLVIKPCSVDGRPTGKLSDSPGKASGSRAWLRYARWLAGQYR